MKTKPITLRFEQEDYDLAIEHSGMKIQALVNRLISDYTAQFKQPLIVPVPYERITDELKDHLKVDTEDLAKYIGEKLKENDPDKVAGKVVVKELNKEGSKPYRPKEENPRFKIVNGKRVFK